MPPATTPRLSDAFDPRVTAFSTAAFSLGEDLNWLDGQRALRAPVGVILHSTRIVEVLARNALELSHLATRDDGLYETLGVLLDYHHLAAETACLLHRLRELGNIARHVRRKVSFDDAEQGYAILVRGLHWYFCAFREGPSLPCLTVYNQPLDDLLPSGPAALLKMLDESVLNADGFVDALGLRRGDCPLLVSSVFAAVVAERLLASKRFPQAQAVLTAALERCSDDVRLRQLQGVLWSRTGRLDEACALLEGIETTDSAADEETQGILAGAYKRRAQAESQQEWLAAAHAKYERGWQQSRRSNTYLGINAATLAVWLGRSAQGTAIAEQVRALLQERQRQLASGGAGAGRFLNCWDQLTLAEAHLLLQDWGRAREGYRVARERFSNRSGELVVAREQAKKDLEALGRGDLLEEVFPG
jgi:hypothetical protein